MAVDLRRRAGRLLDRTLLTSWRATREFVEDRAHRDAAQIAFFAVLSFVPLALLLVGGFGLVFDDNEVRRRVIDVTFDSIPLASERDRPRLERTVESALDSAGRLGPVSILLLVVSATGVMGAMRHAINEAWDIHERPSILFRKALDAALVIGATTLLLVSLSLSATRRAEELVDDEGTGGWLLAGALDVVGDVLPFLFTAAIVLFLYRVLPMHRPKIREIWPGALVAAALLFVIKGVLEVYFEQLSDFGALYGSLGAVMALLVFVYAASIALLFGAEFASEWARLPSDEETKTTVRAGRRRVTSRLSRLTRRARS